MTTLTQPGPLTASTAGAARREAAHARRPVLWLIAGGAGLVALVVAGSWLSRLWRGGVPAAAVHVVEPATLSIELSEDGELKPLVQNEIKNEIEGQSTVLFIVAESTRVKKGDLLVELASNELIERLETEKIEFRRVESEVQTATAELEITKNQNLSDIRKGELDLEIALLELNKYTNGDYIKELNTLEIEVNRSYQEIERKTEDLTKNRKLKEKDFVSGAKIRDLEFDLQNARRTLEKNELALKILHEYDQPKNQKQKTSEVQRATDELDRIKKRAASKEEQAAARLQNAQSTLAVRQTRLARVEEQLQKTKIYAPCDGAVQYSQSRWGWDEERVASGKKVHEGQTLMVLPDTSRMLVSTRIHESDRHQIREGMNCVVRVAAVPGRTFTGKLTKIARFADSTNRWINPDLKEHAAEVTLDPTDAQLAPGDTAEVKILVEQVPNALAAPVQCVHARGPKHYVFRAAGGDYQPVEVTLGRATTTMVEIAGGLKPGDRLLMKSDERFEAMLPAIKPGEKPERVAPKSAADEPHDQPAAKPAADAPADSQPAPANESKPADTE